MVLLGLGAVLVILGATASRSLADNLSTTFLGHLTQNTMWYIVGGIASAIVGLLLLMGVFGRARA
jgi:hypothetical protein